MERFRTIARITLDQATLSVDWRTGRRKILLYTKSYPVLGLDSNGLRVLCRIGYGQLCEYYSEL